ncbi:YdeI/OmpD-associated family protein [Desulfosediminicola flagellatus]|uniref:YdeI/OmpD-associated family protein n=1 Tax=Desulfosediminicola flagellatus TaxID=2569541 RepID=UPI001C3C393B|nr:YdeI/OmpD-associated family protein [Desulfosediminicola flagellatus]
MKFSGHSGTFSTDLLAIKIMISKLFKDRKEWRTWLENNHDKASEIWLVFYKVKTKKKSIKYDEAVEEALCYGWIDSVVRRIDDEQHMQKYTPRKDRSNWSNKNKLRVEKLIKDGSMTEYGLRKIERAKQNGSWNILDSVDIRLETPKALKDAFAQNQRAEKKFEDLAPSRKKQFLWWIESAKRDETKEKRVRETVRLLIENKSLGE